MAEKVIIFRIVVNQENGGFPHASNFITKVVNREPVNVEDVKGIKTKLFYGAGRFKSKEVEFIVEGKGFLDIAKPERLFEGIEDAVCEFCMVVEDEYLQDVLSIQPFILMKLYFKEEHIFAVICGKSSHYFSMNYFLSDIMQKKGMAGSVYYFQKDIGSYCLLEGKKEGRKITAFYPVQDVDRKMLEFLNCELQENWVKDTLAVGNTLEKFTDMDRVTWKETPMDFKGLLKSFRGIKFKGALDERQAVSCIAKASTLSVLVFAFSLRSMKEKKQEVPICNYQQFESYYQMVNDYASGIIQLIENIVYHAGSHAGVFSMRFHTAKHEAYLQKKFSGTMEASCLEISVVDYCGSNACGNMADNFRKNMGQEERLLFTSLLPCHLFSYKQNNNALSREIENAFKEYYKNYENIGKHYGLKLFCNMVIRNKGVFHFYSCNSHTPQDGERGSIATDGGQGVFECFPGTGYSILLPAIGSKEHYYTIDDGQNEFEGFCEREELYLSRQCEPFYFSGYYKSQAEKDAAVKECACYLQREIGRSKRGQIVYIDGSHYREAQAELLFKAMVGQALQAEMPDVVFYHCQGTFVTGMQNSAAALLEKIGWEDIFKENSFCIALYEEENISETLIYPGSLESTYRANLLAINERQKDWLQKLGRQIKYPIKDLKDSRIPYDILFVPDADSKNTTIFERYVEKILQKNIQGKEYGCKLENVHMRLGSMIHVSTFYEAELLFSNRYFVSRFALMVARGIYQKFGEWKPEMQQDFQITICAYGMYSELLVFRIMEILKNIYKDAGEGSIDYAILEREPKDDHLQHIDRFRYSVAFTSKQEREKYFEKRKIISVVPINSTLKTQDKLLEIFCHENHISFESFILNYSLIIVGPIYDNPYWELDKNKKICIPQKGKAIVTPNPYYFVHLPIEYQEANECRLCYPANPLEEKPLVDVNAYSTIPNQSMGIWNERQDSLEQEGYFELFHESDKELRKLYHSLIYSHIGRNGNHFLYYFKTENLFLECKDDIREWLKRKKALIVKENSWTASTYHILFCPVHCSNTGFFEYVNQYVFCGAALVVRLDVNKEYRSNLQTKYSNLRLLVESMGKNPSCKYTVCAHFVDDCIITGKSFRRMQSLAQSLLSSCAAEYRNVVTIIFERIFLLVDRNSNQSKQQYLCGLPGEGQDWLKEGLKNRYFSYINLNISSMRSHGDSCSICQLEWESDGLAKTSSTWQMMKYWKCRKERFEMKGVEEYEEGQRLQTAHTTRKEREAAKEKNYRRMYCCHMAGTLLDEKYHGNQAVLAREAMLRLLLQDLAYRQGKEEEQFEYFLSYLKILSRAFLVYHKSIREAIFPLLLILVHWQLWAAAKGGKDMVCIAGAVWGKGKENKQTYILLEDIGERLAPLLHTRERKRDFLLVCMKQLMEMKSNYFLRRQNMERLTSYIRTWEEDRGIVYDRYLRYVKKLTGVRSDTSKSIWLTEEIKKIMQEKEPQKYLPQDIICRLILENNRAYYDGIEKLSNEQGVISPSDVEGKVHTLRYQDFSRYLQNNEDVSYEAISNTIQLVHYLKGEFVQMPHSEEKTRKKYYDIAGLACDILEAEKVYMLMATTLECEQWRYGFWEKMKEFHARLFPNEEYKREEVQKKEYLVVSISREHETVLEIPISVLANVEKFEEQKRCEHIDGENKYFIWKLGMDEEHPIIFYAKFCENCGYNLIYQCTRFMAINNLLNETAFSSSAIHYLYDIVTAESNAMKLSYYKSFSHTPEDIRKQQYSDVIRVGREKYFQSHVVTLLADLRVSENYRAGLKKDYYSGNLGVRCGKLFGERSILCKMKDFYVVDGMTQEHIKINICRKGLVTIDGKQLVKGDSLVPDGQEIICKGYTNGMDDLLLLLMSLIENAASKGKARVEDTGKEVDVYLSKTKEGNLRIMNEVNEEGDLERIRFFISNPPQPKDGISIWSVSRYLISMECSIVKKMMDQIAAFLEKGEDSRNLMFAADLYHEIEGRLDHQPKMQVDYLRCGEKIYFSIELPILAESVRR